MQCKRCGYPIPRNQSFCSKCFKSIRDEDDEDQDRPGPKQRTGAAKRLWKSYFKSIIVLIVCLAVVSLALLLLADQLIGVRAA